MVKKIIAIVGLTSSGKSDLAIALAKHFNGEIVSADSRQIYKGMDYCTGKVSKQELAEVPHHLIDILPTNSNYNLANYQKDAYAAIDNILSRNKLPILVGGTGLYVRSVVEGYNLDSNSVDEKLREELSRLTKAELTQKLKDCGVTDIDNQLTTRHLTRMLEKVMAGSGLKKPSQPKYKVLQLGINYAREQIYKRIEERLDKRLPYIITEVENLLKTGTTKEFLDRMGLEAKLASDYLLGKFSGYEQFRAELLKQERHYAKRQDTWFKKDNYTIWLDGNTNYIVEAKKLIQDFLNDN